MGFPGLPPAADDADSSLSMAITAGHADHPQHNVGYDVLFCDKAECRIRWGSCPLLQRCIKRSDNFRASAGGMIPSTP